jgi:putative membrane protein
MTFVAPLILLGAPAKTLLCGLPYRIGQASFQSTGLHKVWSALTHPVICWLGAVSTLVVWHIPAVFVLGLRSQMWHGIEQASFLATGLLFWWPVVQPWRSASKWPESPLLVYLFLATLPCDILSGFLVFCDRVVYPAYFSSPQPFGLSALEDQQCAGALMWTCVTLVYLVAGAIVTARLMSSHGSPEYAIRQSETQATVLRKSSEQGMEVV